MSGLDLPPVPRRLAFADKWTSASGAAFAFPISSKPLPTGVSPPPEARPCVLTRPAIHGLSRILAHSDTVASLGLLDDSIEARQ